jgi:hypothetical protein
MNVAIENAGIRREVSSIWWLTEGHYGRREEVEVSIG